MPRFNQQLPPLSLYIHFPWCVQKCPYCDFNSHRQKDELPEKQYISALLHDLENDLPLIWGRKVSTIFMGGGTPSLFSPQAIEELLNGIRARIPVSPFAEITLEANPGTIENERLSGFRQAGVNRLSLGIQSFNDQHLQALGRIHDANKAQQALELASQAGFDSINIDLMHGLPQQDLLQAQQDIVTAIGFKTAHISYYELTLEPNTLFHRNPPLLPDPDLTWDIFQQGIQELTSAGLQRYEISAFSAPKNECQHNLNYWQFGDYLGIGAGAHAKISDANEQNIKRYIKKRHPNDYLSGVDDHNFISSSTELDDEHILFEFLLNALRLTDGFRFETYENHAGLSINPLLDMLNDKVPAHLIDIDLQQQRIKASKKGLNFLNDILQPFVPQRTS